jgi:hypothetical protein
MVVDIQPDEAETKPRREADRSRDTPEMNKRDAIRAKEKDTGVIYKPLQSRQQIEADNCQQLTPRASRI